MSRTRLRLGIDLDGVVADFNLGWTDRYNAEFGTDLHPDDVVEWDAPTGLTHFDGMSEFWNWARSAGHGKSIFRILEPYPGAVEALHDLAGRHQIVIVTTKPAFAVSDTHEWLAEHDIPHAEIHIVEDKATVACDVYLDDADHNLESLRRGRPNAMVCRYVRPWNHPHDGVIDVDDFDEFGTLVG